MGWAAWWLLLVGLNYRMTYGLITTWLHGFNLSSINTLVIPSMPSAWSLHLFGDELIQPTSATHVIWFQEGLHTSTGESSKFTQHQASFQVVSSFKFQLKPHQWPLLPVAQHFIKPTSQEIFKHQLSTSSFLNQCQSWLNSSNLQLQLSPSQSLPPVTLQQKTARTCSSACYWG